MADLSDSRIFGELKITERLHVNGNLLIGTNVDNGTDKLQVLGTISATNFNSTSDINKKKNVKTIENALEKVQSVRGVNFEWKDDGRSGTGVIAQEIESIIPEVVVTDANGNKTVQYGNLIGLLIEAIKDQQKQIIELRNRIDNDK